MSDVHPKTRPRAKRSDGTARRWGAAPTPRAEAGPAREAESARTPGVGPYYSAGPAVGLGPAVQTKLEIGQAGDAYEQEADAVAGRVMSGATLAPPAASVPAMGALVQPQAADEKKPEEKPIQKAEAPKPEEKKPEQKTVQKAETPKPQEKKPEQKTVQKAEGPKPEEKEPEQKSVQKAEAPKPEEKKPEQKTVQKAETKKPEEKKPEAPVQKAEAPKPEEKKPEQKTVRRAEAPKPDEKKPEQKTVQKAEERTPAGGGGRDAHAARGASMADTAEQAIAHAGPGRPMNEQTRSALEARMHRDLSHVRIHDDEAAHKAAADLEARAFTHGGDIWLGAGQSDTDVGLMAHEATHVAQQSGEGGVRRMIQLQPTANLAPPDAAGAATESAMPTVQRRASRQSGNTGALAEGDVGGSASPGGGSADSGAVWPSNPDDPGIRYSRVGRPMVQRAEPAVPAGAAADPGAGAAWDFDDATVGKIKKDDKMVIPTMKVPNFKTSLTKTPFTLRKPGEERSNKQRKIWEDNARAGTGIDSKIQAKLKAENAPSLTKDGKPIYFLDLKGKSSSFYIFGDPDTIKDKSLRPAWDDKGGLTFYDVDHKHEYQLGGADEDINNLWLLESQANQSSGRNIQREKTQRIQALINAASEKQQKGTNKQIWTEAPDLKAVRQQYIIQVQKVEGGLEFEGLPEKNWEIDAIRQGKQFDELKVLNKNEIETAHLQGSPNVVAIYTSETGGGVRFSKDWKEGQKEQQEDWQFGKLFRVDLVRYDKEAKKGSVHVNAFRESKIFKPVNLDVDIQEAAGVEYGGFVSKSSVRKALETGLQVPSMSPVQLPEVELTDQGLVGRGQILPDVPLLKDLQIDLVLDGNNIYLSKVFSAGDLKFPGPIQVTSASLEVFAGTQGIGAKGDVYFKIEQLGKGKLSGIGSTGEGFGVSGDFDFDSKLFDPAKVHAEYKNRKFSGSGEIGIPEGKVAGIRSATITASFEEDKIDAKGSVKPSIPGVEQADLAMTYSKEQGLMIAGDLQLKKDIPGIAGGSVHAEVTKKPDVDRYIVKASGQAKPKIPGIDASLSVTYDDGVFDAVVTASYEKGMLKGSVTVGATNRPVDKDGKPGGAPAEKSDKITVYGGGSATIKLAPWLQGTAAIKIKPPNGEIEVTGEIGLPKSLDIFPEKKLDKNIFTIGIDIPIVGVAVAGQRIGIFANISGGLDLSAGIGPGQLQDVAVRVTYNPAHEEDTHISGGAKLHIPAHAGLRLFVRGSLGVGIPIVSAQAGLEIGGQLGLEGALDAGVQVDWTPTKGLTIDAFGEISVEPKLKFDITGFVLVQADLILTTITLYEKRWQLAAFEYGSGLRLGVKFPIHYQEGKPFEISLSDVQFQLPDINPSQILPDLIKKIA